jgi:hypothetical protein
LLPGKFQKDICYRAPIPALSGRARPTIGSDRGKHDLTLVVMFNRLRFTPARLGAIEQRELIGFDLWREQRPASQPSASTQLSGGGPRSAGRRAPPRCSHRSRGQFHRRRRRGRANRDHAWDDHKSRRWRHGNTYQLRIEKMYSSFTESS